MSAAGFDAVIGNPPYVRMEAFKSLKDYLRSKYACHEERADLYTYFVERGVTLLDSSGLFGMIVSNKFIKAKYGKPLRSFIAANSGVQTIADFAGANVFIGATVRTVVMILRSAVGSSEAAPCYIPVPNPDAIRAMAAGRLSVAEHAAIAKQNLAEDSLKSSQWTLVPKEQSLLLRKLRSQSRTLAEHLGYKALFGLKTGFNAAFIVDDELCRRLKDEDKNSSKVLRAIRFGKDVRRYSVRDGGRNVIYCHPGKSISAYPAIKRHLGPFRTALNRRAGSQQWYELQQPATTLLEYFEAPRIVYPIIAPECRFTIDASQHCINDKLFLLRSSDTALLAILNSRLANFYFGTVCAALEGGAGRYLEFRAQYVDSFPIATKLNAGQSTAGLAGLGQQMLDLHKQLASARTAHAKTAIERQIDATDRQIDQLVYELYALTDDEIRTVEQATR